jgi:hypothetical protein
LRIMGSTVSPTCPCSTEMIFTSWRTLASMGQELKSCMSSEVLGNLLAPVVEDNGGKNDLSMWGHVMQGKSCCRNFAVTRQCQRSHFLINQRWWDWAGEVPPTRVRGRITKWDSKRAGTDQLSIEWELGMMNIVLDRSHTHRGSQK